MTKSERIKELERRVELLEKGFAKTATEPKVDCVVEGGEITSTKQLESVKKEVTELLKSTYLPDWAEKGWATIDEGNQLWIYETLRPIPFNGIWESRHGFNIRNISKVSLNGADWKQCIWKISDLLGEQNQPKTVESTNIDSEFVSIVNDNFFELIDTAQNQPKSDEDLSQNKGNSVVQENEITEPDWENLLDIDDVKHIFGSNVISNSELYDINDLIHERIKPLFKRIEVGEWQLKDAEKQIAELESLTKTLHANLQAHNPKGKTSIQNPKLKDI